jgi:hypothetical protein
MREVLVKVIGILALLALIGTGLSGKISFWR